jgi:hypothetical protein
MDLGVPLNVQEDFCHEVLVMTAKRLDLGIDKKGQILRQGSPIPGIEAYLQDPRHPDRFGSSNPRTE